MNVYIIQTGNTFVIEWYSLRRLSLIRKQYTHHSTMDKFLLVGSDVSKMVNFQLRLNNCYHLKEVWCLNQALAQSGKST